MLSAGVETREINASLVVKSDDGFAIGFGGEFKRGYVDKPILVSNEDELIKYFGKPINLNDYYQVQRALQYSNKVYVSRAVSKGTFIINGNVENVDNDYLVVTNPFNKGDIIKFDLLDDREYKILDVVDNNKIKIDTSDVLNTFIGKDIFIKKYATNAIAEVGKTNDDLVLEKAVVYNEDDFDVKKDSIPVDKLKFIYRYVGSDGNGLKIAIANANSYKNNKEVLVGVSVQNFSDYPLEDDELMVLIIDNDEVVETFIVSLDENKKDFRGQSMFIENVINNYSTYVYVVKNKDLTDALSIELLGDDVLELSLGDDGVLTIADIEASYGSVEENTLLASEDLDIKIYIANEKTRVVAGKIASGKKESIAVIGAKYDSCVGYDSGKIVSNLIADVTGELANGYTANSYCAFYGNYLNIYDKYTNKYIWINIAGDIAGLMAQIGKKYAWWYAVAGIERGKLVGVNKLAFSPSKAQMDILYKNRVNPVVNMKGIANAVVWGQKTLISKPSAFDRLNVRGLFNELKHSIKDMAKYQVFEFNDEFTRNKFTSIVTKYLDSVKAGRGIYDYKVICDETNNTPQVIDNNEFIGTIMVKPTRTAEFITLNFVAVDTGVDFSEIVV